MGTWGEGNGYQNYNQSHDLDYNNYRDREYPDNSGNGIYVTESRFPQAASSWNSSDSSNMPAQWPRQQQQSMQVAAGHGLSWEPKYHGMG